MDVGGSPTLDGHASAANDACLLAAIRAYRIARRPKRKTPQQGVSTKISQFCSSVVQI
jgi:hypothetical protein